MTWLDWVIVAMTIWFLLQGVLKGGLAAFLGAIAVIVSYIGAAIVLPTFGEGIAKALLASMKSLPADWARTVGFLVPFIIAYVAISILINFLPGGKRPSMLAQAIGVLTGLFKALVASMAVVGILMASPFSEAMTTDMQRSTIARPIADMQRAFIKRLAEGSPIPFPPVGPDHKF